MFLNLLHPFENRYTGGAVFEKLIVTQDKNKFGLTIVGHQK